MKRVLILLIPLILLFSGCFAPVESQSAEPTGGAIAVNETHYNYPAELANKVSGLGTGKFVLTESELPFMKTGEKISVEVGKRGISQYALAYELILPKPLNIGESIDLYWFHEKATITYSNTNNVAIKTGGKIIQLKNFNAYKEITKEKFNAELIKKDGKLTGIKVYNTQVMKLDEVTKLYNQ